MEAASKRLSLSQARRGLVRGECSREVYQGEEVVIAIPDGEVLEGSIQQNKMKLVHAWIEIHRDDLMANCDLVVNGQEVFKIYPLK